MKIEYHRIFLRNYKKRIFSNKKLKDQFKDRIRSFIKNSQNPILRDHPLSGDLSGFRSFSITGDVRVVYIKTGRKYLFYDIGSHNQVYT